MTFKEQLKSLPFIALPRKKDSYTQTTKIPYVTGNAAWYYIPGGTWSGGDVLLSEYLKAKESGAALPTGGKTMIIPETAQWYGGNVKLSEYLYALEGGWKTKKLDVPLVIAACLIVYFVIFKG